MFEKYFKKLKQIKMDPEAKEDIRDFLFDVALTREEQEEEKIEAEAIETSRPNRIFTYRIAAGVLSVVLFIFGISNVFAKSEQALPGNILYPVKVNVIEKIRYLMASSTEEKARLEATFTKRRLQETSTLLLRNELDQDIKTQMKSRITMQLHQIHKMYNVLNNKQNADTLYNLSGDMSATLNAYDTLFNAIAAAKDNPLQKQNALDFSELLKPEIISNSQDRFYLRDYLDKNERDSVTNIIRERFDSTQKLIISLDLSANKPGINPMKKSVASEKMDIAKKHLLESAQNISMGDFSQAFDDLETANDFGEQANVILQLPM